MSVPNLRVLVVDDSAFARKVVREVLEAAPGIEVVGIARDGLEALEKVEQLAPDVVTLDLVMPNLDGVGFLRELKGRGPRVILVSMSNSESELAISALELGALDLVQKPTALATSRLYEIGSDLVAKVRIAAIARRASDASSFTPAPPRETRPLDGELRPNVTEASTSRYAADRTTELMVIGTSTGGPHALTKLLPRLPGDFPVPIVIALHIPEGFTEALAARLDSLSEIHVVEATHGMPLQRGTAILARGGVHIRVVRRGGEAIIELDATPTASPYWPSVDALFESAAANYGAGVLGVVMTGMGDDGLRGARAITARGGRVLTEKESSCVVYGMPRCVHEAGLSTAEADLSGLAELIVRSL